MILISMFLGSLFAFAKMLDWMLKAFCKGFTVLIAIMGVLLAITVMFFWLCFVIGVDVLMLVIWCVVALICHFKHVRVPSMHISKYGLIWPSWK